MENNEIKIQMAENANLLHEISCQQQLDILTVKHATQVQQYQDKISILNAQLEAKQQLIDVLINPNNIDFLPESLENSSYEQAKLPSEDLPLQQNLERQRELFFELQAMDSHSSDQPDYFSEKISLISSKLDLLESQQQGVEESKTIIQAKIQKDELSLDELK
ncbi:hypothetical protein SS50377_25528 [Spironucleus salmonicida]|nr:hypothetical protein SS50377_25528 [Spironucleus salmonicida]